MMWERINVKPLVNLLFFKSFDKTGNFAVQIYCAVPVPAYPDILTQKRRPALL